VSGMLIAKINIARIQFLLGESNPDVSRKTRMKM
jgi:hypothetical protein